MEKDHGYNFEVPATDKIGLADPIPLKAMGRFRHEAIDNNSFTQGKFPDTDGLAPSGVAC